MISTPFLSSLIFQKYTCASSNLYLRLRRTKHIYQEKFNPNPKTLNERQKAQKKSNVPQINQKQNTVNITIAAMCTKTNITGREAGGPFHRNNRKDSESLFTAHNKKKNC